MFKLIFRTVIIIIFLVFITAGLAVWKGGGPFRYFGDGVITVGKSIGEFGDFVDGFKSESKKLRKDFNKLKDTITPDEGKGQKEK